MTLILTQSLSAVGALKTSSFLAAGGAEPYMYSVLSGGAGGTIDATTGVYTAPVVLPTTPQTQYDIIQVEDYAAVTATLPILVGHPLILFCDVLQTEMGLANGRVYLFDQKIMQPTDSDLYIAVSVPSCKPFANVNRQAGEDGDDSEQYVSMLATLDIDIISRGPAARNRKEEVVMAFNGTYSQQQQEANGFYIAKLPPGSRFINLSEVDGAAIPYRFKISVNIQYTVTKNQALPYFDDFTLDETIDPVGGIEE